MRQLRSKMTRGILNLRKEHSNLSGLCSLNKQTIGNSEPNSALYAFVKYCFGRWIVIQKKMDFPCRFAVTFK